MKFAALFKKELRLCLPWLLLSILIFGGIGLVIMKNCLLYQENRINDGYNQNNTYYLYTPQSPIADFAPLVILTSLSLGVILAVVQFFLPELYKTWSFTIHRSIRPPMIIWSKFAAAGLTFLISLGLLWTLFYIYSAGSGRFYIPVFFKTCVEGWIYILAGMIAYWGTALSAISATRLYGTRLLGIAVASIIIFFLFMQISLLGAITWILVGATILIIQIFHTLLSREY